jgi:hypothetical protein
MTKSVANLQVPVKRHREDHELQGLLETLVSQRLISTPNPPPGPKWKAKAGLHRLGLNGAEGAVIWLLIDCANRNSGLCYPSQEYIAGRLDLTDRTVRRAIASLKKRKLIKTMQYGKSSNRYEINWQPFFAAFATMEAYSKRQKVAAENPLDRPHLAAHDRPDVAA